MQLRKTIVVTSYSGRAFEGHNLDTADYPSRQMRERSSRNRLLEAPRTAADRDKSPLKVVLLDSTNFTDAFPRQSGRPRGARGSR